MERVSKVAHVKRQEEERDGGCQFKIHIDKKEEMDRVSKIEHVKRQDEQRGEGGHQDPHRQEGRDGQGIQGRNGHGEGGKEGQPEGRDGESIQGRTCQETL